MPIPLIALGAMAAAPSIVGMFSGGDADKQINELAGLNTALGGEAKQTSEMGTSVLGPAVDYLKSLAGGDRQQMLAATMPQRRRVMDQYDAAKKSIAEFAPRGGGQASAMINLEANKASDLSMLGAGAQRDAVTESAQLGTALKQTSLGAQGQQGANLNSQISAILQQAQTKGMSAAGLGEALGMLFGDYYFNQQAGTQQAA